MPSRSYYFHLTKKEEKKIINRVCALFAVFMPLTTLPQIIQLYSTKSAGGLSLLMWVLYMVGCVPFLLFGIIYKHKQLILLNVLWLFVQGVMIVGIVLYG